MKDWKIIPREYIPRDDAVILDIKFPYKGLEITGDVYLPVKARCVTVFLHGLGQNHDNTIPIRDVLPEYSAIIKTTQTGHPPVGGNIDPRLNEEITRYILDRVYDLCHSENVFLAAHSAGCHPAMAAARRDDVLGVILISPPYDLSEPIIKRRLGVRMGIFTAKHSKKASDYLNGREWKWKSKATGAKRKIKIDDIPQSAINIIETPKLGKYEYELPPPFLGFHGTEDKVVEFGDSVQLKEDLEEKGIPMQLVLLNGATHYPMTERGDVLRMGYNIREWMNWVMGADEQDKNWLVRKHKKLVRDPIEERRRFSYVEQLLSETDPDALALE